MSEPAPALIGELTGAVSFETAPLINRIAQPDEIDELGHVNNAVYLVWAQDMATMHWMHVGSIELVQKYLWVALRHEIDYRDPVLEGEMVEIRTWLGRARGVRFERHIDIRKKGAARFSAKVLTDWCLIDAATRKPCRIGEDVLGPFGVSGAAK